MGQLSFYSAEARQPCLGDLAGLLCGPGQALGFARGRAARVSVGVDTRERAAALVAALAERGVQARVELVRTEPVRIAAAEGLPAETGQAEAAAPADDGLTDDGPAGRIPVGRAPVGRDPAERDPVEDDPAEDEPVDSEPVDEDPVIEPDDMDPDGSEVAVIGSGRRGPVAVESESESSVPGTDAPEPGPPPPEVRESWQVTTAFRTDLAGLAAQWVDGHRKVVPPDFTLDGGALRLWALASGRWVESGSGYLLGLDPAAPGTHETLRKALATSGLPATLLTGKSGEPALRVVGRRRLERLAELVGRAPRGVAERTWPAA